MIRFSIVTLRSRLLNVLPVAQYCKNGIHEAHLWHINCLHSIFISTCIGI